MLVVIWHEKKICLKLQNWLTGKYVHPQCQEGQWKGSITQGRIGLHNSHHGTEHTGEKSWIIPERRKLHDIHDFLQVFEDSMASTIC